LFNIFVLRRENKWLFAMHNDTIKFALPLRLKVRGCINTCIYVHIRINVERERERERFACLSSLARGG
jgi:hypothetical protein